MTGRSGAHSVADTAGGVEAARPRAVRRLLLAGLLGCAVAVGVPGITGPGTLRAAAAGPCTTPVVSRVACENTLGGEPQANWDVKGSGDQSIQGFATDMSVNAGGTISFKVSTPASSYHADILRLGYYGGSGARLVASGLHPGVTLPQSQPSCLSDASTGLVDCGNWAVSLSWAVPSSAVSGVYLAHLVRDDTGGASQIYFVVRNDSSSTAMVYQTSDTTWQAYNRYGGNDFYVGAPAPQVFGSGRAYKVSYNRPLITRDCCSEDFLMYAEYPLIRFLEANGYDVSYISGVDTDRAGALLQQHRVFVDGGHDEYWSGAQRANVEAARDAGVSFASFSGNNLYWKTRWEASIDGSGTAYRTLVCYKETWANSVTDPKDPGTWTGSWRDPRFSPPADGGRPENALLGTLWTVNLGSATIQVSSQYSHLRFWRNTAVASLAAGQSISLAPNSVGYEWNEDVDNGFRPAGLFDMSSTTVNVQQKILDYGSTIGPGTATHSLTLYRAASGALVFSAGSVQWSWGLDDTHDGVVGATDTSMRQATVNVFADMGARGLTLDSDLVPATASTDTTAPTSHLTAPSSGQTVSVNTPVTISGTATDSGGGVVAGVEVSTDGGTTWHPAQGTSPWSYTWAPSVMGTASLRTRAVDDSGNIEAPSAGLAVTVVSTCPCSIFSPLVVPQTATANDANSVEVGVRFKADTDGTVSGIRFYKGTTNTGTHVGHLWTATGTLLATATFANESASGWQEADFGTPVAVAGNTTYVASYLAPNGRYSDTLEAFATSGSDAGYLHALRDGQGGSNGVFAYGANGGFPTGSYEAANYFVDVAYSPSPGPRVTATSPASGATGAATNTAVTATFSRAIAPGTLSFGLADPSGTGIPATVTYDAASQTATLQPGATLVTGTSYTATVSAQDTGGNAMVLPYSWTFTTTGVRPCPCSIWSAGATPAQPSTSDASPVELGVKFRADVSGFVTGVRFYKGAGNTGTHVGHLWSAGGTLLAGATFSNETASGWQQVTFSQAVAVSANTTYVVSYLAPAGHYAVTANAFAAAVDNAPVHALADAGSGNPDGVYRYGASGGFPTSGYNRNNYWVDVVFVTQLDPTPPSVTSHTPASAASGVPVTANVTATFDRAVQQPSVSVQVRDASSNLVAGSLAYDPTLWTATFTPSSALAVATAYTVSVTATGASGTAMTSPATWSFTTEGANCPCSIRPPSATPSTVDSGDAAGVELGLRFTSDIAGSITGVRFYLAPGNTGPHIVNLWSSSGTLLASATATGETGSGWQQAAFPGAVAISANTTYVASYYAPHGHYSVTPQGLATGVDNPPLHALSNAAGGGNGVYAYGAQSGFPASAYNASDYGVDMVFALNATTAPRPSVTAQSPAPNAVNGSSAAPVTATFNEAVQGSSVAMTLRDGSGNPIAGSVSYGQASYTAAFTPSAALTPGATYTATVSATGVDGQTMAAPVTWSFIVATPACPCTLFTAATAPAVPDAGDTGSVELGVAFRSDVAGYVTGVRFYKSTANTGIHVGSLWSATGALLAQATFTAETGSGWQQVTFSSPVAVAAGTYYVASYHAPAGHYAAAGQGFASAVDSPPLHAPSGATGANGLYGYGSGSVFPSSSYNAANYFVDVVFSVSPPLAGDGTVESTADTLASGTASAYQVVATQTGNGGAAYVYLDAASTASRVAVGLYSDASGQPASLLGQATIGAPIAGAWNRIAFPGVALTAGTHYWIALLTPSGSGTLVVRDGGGGQPSVSSAQASLPATWSGGTSDRRGTVSAYIGPS